MNSDSNNREESRFVKLFEREREKEKEGGGWKEGIKRQGKILGLDIWNFLPLLAS